MLDHRNELVTGHMLTFEDPIEFLFRNKKSIINQREIGSDAKTLYAALKSAMRQAPDVIFIGEIRDRETMTAAIAYAMSGHLVVATLHATNSSHALNRVISFYPPEVRQALFQDMSVAVKAIVSQRLVRSKRGGRVPAVEVLLEHRPRRRPDRARRRAGDQGGNGAEPRPGEHFVRAEPVRVIQSDHVTREDALAAADSQSSRSGSSTTRASRSRSRHASRGWNRAPTPRFPSSR